MWLPRLHDNLSVICASRLEPERRRPDLLPDSGGIGTPVINSAGRWRHRSEAEPFARTDGTSGWDLTGGPLLHTLCAMGYQDRITIEPGKRGGKPCVRGLRITVSDVLDYLASGMSEDEVLRDFPDLTHDDIRACLAFAADRERRLVAVGSK